MASERSTSHVSTPVLTDQTNTPADESQRSQSPYAVPETPPYRSHALFSLSSEATIFLSQLSNFLALGCLVCEEAVNHTPASGDDQDCAEWQDSVLHAVPLELHLSGLISAGWIRVQQRRSFLDHRYTIYRIYVLPGDVGLRFIDRDNKKLSGALESLMSKVDVRPDTWNGNYISGTEERFDQWASRDEGSLFYMFNKLPSPRPDASIIKEKYAREAVEDILDPRSALIGLKTPLYPYQRRSAALMLQRESVSTLLLDPRLEARTAPDGSLFYYGPRDLLLNRNPRYYEASRGGILAETMGLGKTLMCLALILSTRRHLPKVPAAYRLSPIRGKTASLADMAVSAINRMSVPWKVEFERIEHSSHDDMSSCANKLESEPPSYEIPVEPVRWNRKTVIPPPLTKTLASTTILVVPRNLCKQWHSEIQKHVEEGVLRILLMEEPKAVLPSSGELRKYDVVLFSRSRFEAEVKDGADDRGRRLVSRPPSCNCPYIGATRTVDCHCVKTNDLYESPLKQLHFKRLIIDEGHFFSSSNTTAVSVAKKLVTADHRWVVSGTPAKDLLGVEADMSVAQNISQSETIDSRDTVLDRRRHFNAKDDTAGAIKSLGLLASNFLRIRPWAAEEFGERSAVWDEHIYRHEGRRRRTYSGFSAGLRRTLEAMVIKTQPEDVEQDIELPALSHEVIRLQPSFYDKLTANLFTIVLTANAVTSERTDADYLFHKNSAQALYQLIGNLRQSAFFWTGFSKEDVKASKKNGWGYLNKAGVRCSDEDRRFLEGALRATKPILSSAGWKALSQSHELGMFVDSWPEESADFWAFGGNATPLLTGISQLLEAQKHVNERVGLEHPGEGLAGLGIRAMKRAQEGRREDQMARKETKPTLSKTGINLTGEPSLKRRASTSGSKDKGAAKRARMSPKASDSTKAKKKTPNDQAISGEDEAKLPPAADTSASKRRWSDFERSELSDDSAFSRSYLTGTASAKLSYLTSQILQYYRDEKILVFYEGDNIAYYIAQMLELLHIKHEIYAKSLAANLKSEYVVRFNEEPQDRVLIMDVRHASHGLNISSASRIYFVNPVCRPDIEAQAIKRAHRIGQTRKVFVETLLLAGTIEEKMYERAKRMTNLEHHVSHLEDDYGMREIIQGASIIPVTDHERSGPGQMAPLDEPQRLWGRPGWRESLPKSSFSTGKDRSAEGPVAPDTLALAKRVRKKKRVRLAEPRAQSPIVAIPILSTTQSHAGPGPVALDNGSHNDEMRNNENNEDDEPLMTQWLHRPQETQDAVEGYEEVQNHTFPAAAFAGDQTVGTANIGTDLPGDRTNSHQLSIAELLN
jgi:SNF2 family DNA or RNA helicase